MCCGAFLRWYLWWAFPNRKAHWTLTALGLCLVSACLLAATVAVDVLFLLETNLVAQSLAAVVYAPTAARSDVLLLRHPGANSTAVATCNASVAAHDPDFLNCALGAYPCVDAHVEAYVATVNGTDAAAAYGDLRRDADFWRFVTDGTPGVCYYVGPDWGGYADVVIHDSTVVTVVTVSAVAAALAIYMRIMARDRGCGLVLAMLLIIFGVVAAPLALLYMSQANAMAEACWSCLASVVATCAACATEPAPEMLLYYYVLGASGRLLLLAEFMYRAALHPEHRLRSALWLLLTVPLWLPVLAAPLVAAVVMDPTGLIYRVTRNPSDPVAAMAMVAQVGTPIGVTVLVLFVPLVIVLLVLLHRRARNNGSHNDADDAASDNAERGDSSSHELKPMR